MRSLLHAGSVVEERDPAGALIGASVLEDDNILLLCVDRSFRNRGIGSRLPAESERIIRQNRFDAVSLESEGPSRGSVGCTAVRKSHQGHGIASNLVILGTRHLKDCGMQEAFLGYTYSGLDRLYGSAGYRICRFYFMAKKAL